ATGSGEVVLQSVARSFDLQVQSSRLEEAMRDGVIYTIDVPVPKRGAFQVRAAVRDGASSRVGSATQFIDIPELKRTGFALTSVVVQDGSGATSKSASPAITPARRFFRPGAELQYICAIQKNQKEHRISELTARVRIVRDSKEVYSAPAEVVEVPGAGPAVF